MSAIITIEDVERFRASDFRAAHLVRDHQVTRNADPEPVWTVAGQTVRLRQVHGGYLAIHDCPSCAADTPCFRALAAVDAEGTERWIVHCEAVYHATKLEMAR
jgi:hypothetical protein